MGKFALQKISQSAASSPESLIQQLNQTIDSLEQQLNGQPTVASSNNNKTQSGLLLGDPVFRLFRGILQVGVWNGKTTRYLNTTDLQSLQSNGTNFLGTKTGTVVVTSPVVLALFPLQNDWGFYNRTSTTDLFLVYNYNGTTLYKIQLV